MTLCRLVALASFVLLVAPPTAALGVRVDFSGSIDQVSDPTSGLLPQFGVGASFAGSFELDPALATLLPGLPFEVYAFPLTTDPLGPSALSGEVVLGGVTLGGLAPFPTAGVNGIGVFDDAPLSQSALFPPGLYDAYVMSYVGAALLGTSAPVGSTNACGVGLFDSTAGSFAGGFFVPSNLSTFDYSLFSCGVVLSDGSDLAGVSGTITSWVVTPEPAPILMLVVSTCVGSFSVARRRL